MYILLITTNYQNSVSIKIQEMMNLILDLSISQFMVTGPGQHRVSSQHLQDYLLYAGGNHTQNPAGVGLWRCGSSTD